MNLPNLITVGRMVLIPVFVVLYLTPGMNIAAVVVFAIAALSDAVDGYIARKYNLITNFGKFMDPLADKMLTCAGFVLLVGAGRMPAWVCILVLAREFMVTGLRTVAVEQGVVIAASMAGKVKTTVQMVGLVVMLLSLSAAWTLGPLSVDAVLNGAIAVVTVWSGLEYLWKNRNLFSQIA